MITLDNLPIIISILSLTLSVIIAVSNYFQNKNNKKIDMNSIYYNKIFDEYLMVKIPIAVDSFRYENNLKDYGDFERILTSLRKSIIFFKFKDRDFYVELETKIIEIDEYLMELLDKDNINDSKFHEMLSSLEKKIESLYEIIENKYLNG